jgi:ABC-type protease/lipase transport system fused ATPase/permease subunit
MRRHRHPRRSDQRARQRQRSLAVRRLRESGTTLISIAHRAAVLRHHTHVLRLMGEGAWEVHDASGYQFDAPVAEARSSATRPPAHSRCGRCVKVVAVT